MPVLVPMPMPMPLSVYGSCGALRLRHDPALSRFLTEGWAMGRLERFYKIDQLLQSRRIVSREAFLEELEVSLATFKRDLEYMRDRFNAPVLWDAPDALPQPGQVLGKCVRSAYRAPVWVPE